MNLTIHSECGPGGGMSPNGDTVVAQGGNLTIYFYSSGGNGGGGSPVATVVSKNTDANGYYTTATIATSGATPVDWIAIGTGIGA